MQKTAYEMRISDLSSDVCSSDLIVSHLLSLLLGSDRSHGRRRSQCLSGRSHIGLCSRRLFFPERFSCFCEPSAKRARGWFSSCAGGAALACLGCVCGSDGFCRLLLHACSARLFPCIYSGVHPRKSILKSAWKGKRMSGRVT